MRTAPASVVHIEDEALWHEAVANLMAAWPEVRLVGSAPSGTEGLALCRDLQPTIILLDLWLPDVDGFDLAERIRALPNPPHIVLLTGRGDDMALARFHDCSFAGVLWKDHSLLHHLRPALTAVRCGQRYVPAEVRDAMQQMRRSPTAFTKLLTTCQQALLPFFGRGETDAAIAARVGRRPSAIHALRQRIMGKIGVHRGSELERWAVEKGFVPKPRPGSRRD